MRIFVCLSFALTAGFIAASPVLAQTAPAAGVDPATQAAPTFAAEPTFSARIARRAGELGIRSPDQEDVAALQAYYGSNPEKPLWIENGAFSARARAVVAEIGRADDWGLAAADFTLPNNAAGNGPDALAEAEARLTLAVLKYARHARGGRFDPTRLSDALDRTPNLIEPAKLLQEIATAPEADTYLRKLHPQHPQFERLRQLLLAVRAGKIEAPPAPVAEEPEQPAKGRKGKKVAKAKKPATPPPLTAERVLVNMEQWRWMPGDLGKLHAVVNIPEFTLRVVKDDAVVHTERVVVGTPANPTPIFSKDMQTVLFQPGWGVPSGIKVKELLPRLLAGGDPITGRGLVVRYRGREADPRSIDWRVVDIRKVSIVQPPGPSNALGMVKFLFPNKHDVYMHDTPSKSLFNAEMRAFSHGCVRVRNPMRFAEVVFAETGGWSPSRVASLARGKPENEVAVPAPLSVHMTYFTMTVDDAGKAHTYRDIYGHEPRIRAALDGQIDKVARKSEDLGQLRASMVNRAPRVTRSERSQRPERRAVAEALTPRQRPAPRSRTASSGGSRSGGGGFFNVFSGF